MKLNQMISSVLEQRNDLGVDLAEQCKHTHTASLDDLVRLGYSNLLHCYTSFVLNVLQHHLVFVTVKSDASSCSTRSSRTA